MDTKILLENIAKFFGFANLELDENNCLSLSFDEIVVTLLFQENELLLVTKLIDLPLTKKQELYTMFLVANNLYMGTNGGVIGIDEVLNYASYANKVLLKYADANLVIEILEKHIQAVEALRLEIQERSTPNKQEYIKTSKPHDPSMLRI